MLMRSLTQSHISTKAKHITIQSLLNSILVDNQYARIVRLPMEQAIMSQCHKAVRIGELTIPIMKFSKTGLHDYLSYGFNGFEQVTEYNLIDAIFEQLQLLGVNFDLDKFQTRIAQSNDLIATSLYKRRFQLLELFNKRKISFIEAEQSLIYGHTCHPYPKLREGFSKRDLEHYSPEEQGKFSLTWLLVNLSLIDFQNHESTNELESLFKIETSSSVPKDFTPYPMHPWQWHKLKKIKWIQDALLKNEIIEIASNDEYLWHPTSSLRTVYRKDANIMLKFSMDLRITNSVRHLQKEEVVRGLQFMRVLNSEKGKEFTSLFPSFKILKEPGYIALKNNSLFFAPSAVTWRHNPFVNGNDDNCITLAALTQDSPFDPSSNLLLSKIGKNKLIIKSWFSQFLEIAVKPFITAQANYGLYFGAHQQNIVLKLDDKDQPQNVYFRDCQGTGYEQSAYENLIQEIPALKDRNGNDLPKEIGNMLIGYYLIINSCFGVINALTRSQCVSEQELFADLANFLRDQLKNSIDQSFLKYLLESPLIYQKNNFNCCIGDHNENTVSNPFEFYNKINNPLYANE